MADKPPKTAPPEPAAPDAINPDHYRQLAVQPIDVQLATAWPTMTLANELLLGGVGGMAVASRRAVHAQSARDQALKYIWRAGDKVTPGEGHVQAIVRDLKKARWYIDRALWALGAGDDPARGS